MQCQPLSPVERAWLRSLIQLATLLEARAHRDQWPAQPRELQSLMEGVTLTCPKG